MLLSQQYNKKYMLEFEASASHSYSYSHLYSRIHKHEHQDKNILQANRTDPIRIEPNRHKRQTDSKQKNHTHDCQSYMFVGTAYVLVDVEPAAHTISSVGGKFVECHRAVQMCI